MGCTFSLEEDDAMNHSPMSRKRHGLQENSDVGPIASDTNVRTSTKQRSNNDSDMPKSSSHFQLLAHATDREKEKHIFSTSLATDEVAALPHPHVSQDMSRGNRIHLSTGGEYNSPSLGALDTPMATYAHHTSLHPARERGSIRVLSRGVNSPQRDHSHSPTPTLPPAGDSVTPVDASAPGSGSPLRRDLASRFPPNLNLQGRARLARELDSPEPSLMDISPRLSARMSQTAAIRNNLARQASLTQHQMSPGQPSSILMALQQHHPAPVATVTTIVTPSTTAGAAATTTDVPAGDSRRGMVLNPRRHGSGGDSPASGQRFLTPVTLPAQTSRSMRHSSNRGSQAFSAAIDLIDATSSPLMGDLSPANRHSLRASRHSLGQLPVPLNPTGNGPESGRRSTRGRGRGRKTALVVDNNTLSQRLTTVALHRSGFTCCDVAGGGEAAISMAQNERYELILVDTALPTLSGIETTAAIRWIEDQRGDAPATILTLTNVVDAASLQSYRDARISGCIEKGCIIAEAVVDAIDALSRNPNFVYIPCNGPRQQEARTEQQDAAEAAVALMRGEKTMMERERARSNASPNRDITLSPHATHEGAPVHSNRRTTATGRNFPVLSRKMSRAADATLTVAPAPGHSSNDSFSHLSIPSLPSSPCNDASSSFFGTPRVPAAIGQQSRSARGVSTNSVAPPAHSQLAVTAPRPRRASLSVHAIPPRDLTRYGIEANPGPPNVTRAFQ